MMPLLAPANVADIGSSWGSRVSPYRGFRGFGWR